MSLRKKSLKKNLGKDEVNHLRKLNNAQARAEITGLTPEQAAKIGQSEEKVFFKKGEMKGKIMNGGENQMVYLGDDSLPGTPTFIEYQDKRGVKKVSSTIITEDKKLISPDGQIIRELY